MSQGRTRGTVRRLLAALAATSAVGLAGLAAAPAASADTPFGHPMPGGNWTFVRSDAFLHYACKIPMSGGYGPVYRVKTLTWYNGNRSAVDQGIGVYTVTTRGSDRAIVDSRSQNGWFYGFSGTELWASAWYEDRLWMQGAYYGPSRPWTDGVKVRNLATC